MDPIALIGKTVVTLNGCVQISASQVWMLRRMIDGGLRAPRDELRKGLTNRAFIDAMRHTNEKLARVRWRVRGLTMSDGSEVYALTEVLRNENGRLGRAPTKPE